MNEKLNAEEHLRLADFELANGRRRQAQRHFVNAMLGYYGMRPKGTVSRLRRWFSIELIRIALLLIPNEK